MTPTSSAPRPIVVRDLLLLALAACGGALDAVSYVHLHAFSANMTGNTVLFALGLGAGDPQAMTRTGASLGAFALGAFLGTAIGREADDEDPWPRTVARPMLLEVLALAALGVCWTRLGGGPAADVILVAIGSFAMGIQSGVTHDVHLGGASTTYMTGTVARAAEFVADSLRFGFRGGLVLNATIWFVYLGAATLVGVLTRIGAPLERVPWGVAAAVLVIAAAGPSLVRRAAEP